MQNKQFIDEMRKWANFLLKWANFSSEFNVFYLKIIYEKANRILKINEIFICF